MPSLFGVPVDAAYHVVTAISAFLTPVAGALAVAAAIVVFTITVRLLVLPFSYYALRGQLAQARIAPQAQALRQRFAQQPDRLARELKALYAEHGTGMFAGCLPLLLQWPFLSVMYLLFRSGSVGGGPNRLLSHYLFGAQLGSHWLSGAGAISGQGAVFAGLFVLLAVIGWLSARVSRRFSAAPPTGLTQAAKPAPPAATPVPSARQAAGLPSWVVSLMPLLTAVIAAFLPLAAGLYLLTTTAWTLLERVVLRRFLLPAPDATARAGSGTPAPAGKAAAAGKAGLG